jgi:hypothetical protein
MSWGFGGVSGGGGNVLYPQAQKTPAPTSLVRTTIEDSHSELVQYLKQKYDDYQRGSLSPEEKGQFELLFRQPRDVLAISATKRLEIESGRPCLDANSQPVDADIRGDMVDRVCVSSFSLARKVEKRRLHSESAALLAHEFSELAGFEEDDAVRLQALVLKDFQAK